MSPKNHSAGILSGTCSCSQHIERGFYLMTSNESIAMVLSLRLMFHLYLGVMFYDNCCNCADSVSLRVPSIFPKSIDRVDPFHYGKSHKCASAHDPESSKGAYDMNGSASESSNSGTSRLRRSVRYLGSECAMPYLAS